MTGKRFRIAFSFAGEKRDFVEKVACILARQFGEAAILYDKFHEAEFARARLGRYLPKLYHDESDLVVVVICRDYMMKEWPGLEWDAIFDLLKKRREDDVTLCRFDNATIDGLFSDAGFIELDDKTPTEFATLILERLALNEGKPKNHYTKPTPLLQTPLTTTIPHNLPSLLPFFGRENELQKIADSLLPQSRTWGALIDGPGGMGKTSLAVRAAYDASPEFFKKIIFVSLKRRKLDAIGVRDLSGFILSGLVELLNQLARELGQPDIAKAPEEHRPRLLLDALRGKQALLILDNLESLVKKDRDTVFTLVENQPPGCKAILTCRGRIGDGGIEIILKKLSQDAAIATLAELATHNPDLAKTGDAERIALYSQTDGNPLLLRWTAGQLGRGSCLTFTDALHFLRSCPEGNDPLEFIFGDLVDDFSEAETRVICALTYFTLPAKVEHVATVSNLPEPETDRALRSLTVRSLAVPSDELRTFTLVPMVADFLRKKKPEVVAETGDRLEQRAYDLIVENGYKKHDRFPVLDAAWPSVAPALPLFLVGPNPRLQTVCDALWRFLDFSGRWDEWLALSGQAEGKAVTAKDFLSAGWRAYDIGWVHCLRGQSTEVLRYADRAATYYGKAPAGARESAFVMRLRGVGFRLAKNYSSAIDAFRQAVELRRSLDKATSDVPIALNDLANAEKESGDLDSAEIHYREALDMAKTVGYEQGVASYTGHLADVALRREQWPYAEKLAREALTLGEKVGRQKTIAGNCRRLAKALVRQGQAAEAMPHARRAVDIYTKLGSPELAEAEATLRECEG